MAANKYGYTQPKKPKKQGPYFTNPEKHKPKTHGLPEAPAVAGSRCKPNAEGSFKTTDDPALITCKSCLGLLNGSLRSTFTRVMESNPKKAGRLYRNG